MNASFCYIGPSMSAGSPPGPFIDTLQHLYFIGAQGLALFVCLKWQYKQAKP